MEAVIVTRYLPLAEYLKAEGIVAPDTPVVFRVRPEDVKGRHVYGTLPVWLAAFAEKVTEYVLVVPPDVKPELLGVGEIGRYLRTPVSYRVSRIEEVCLDQ